ncbi:MAG: nucleotide exchange factor GrpE [Planctomycetota bacterium]
MENHGTGQRETDLFDEPAIADPTNGRSSDAAAGRNKLDDAPDTIATAALVMARAVEQQFAALTNVLQQVGSELQSLRQAPTPRPGDAVHADVSERYRELCEQFHEREVLLPILRTLIVIIDRCLEQESQLQQAIDRRIAAGADAAIIKALRQRKAMRTADRTDIENVLRAFGVDPFQSPDSTFDRSLQTAVGRIPCRDGQVPGQVANRLRLGYRRGARIVRPECVEVFVKPSDS